MVLDGHVKEILAMDFAPNGYVFIHSRDKADVVDTKWRQDQATTQSEYGIFAPFAHIIPSPHTALPFLTSNSSVGLPILPSTPSIVHSALAKATTI